MLIFFIHGVATRDLEYAEPLKNALKKELIKINKTNLCCFAGYTGWMHSNKLKVAIESIKKYYC